MAIYARIIRIALALAAFICGALSSLAFPADNIPYCSSGFEKPARIVLSDTQSMYLNEGNNPEIHFDAPKVTLSVGDGTEVFSFHEPGEGATILSYSHESGARLEIGEAGSYLAEAKIGETKVIIFADRVFWPCEE